jgi:hypothetical protein
MANTPAYAASPRHSSTIAGTAETSLTAPVNSSTLWTAGANGSKIEQITVQAVTTSLTPTTTTGLVYVFLYNGTTYSLFDTISITAQAATTTSAPFSLTRTYNNLVVASGSSVAVSQSVAGNANILKVIALGADY